MNKLPQLRQFVKDKGEADSYENLGIKFIPGRKPELVCFNGEDEVDRVDLSGMTKAQCHELVVSKGFKKKAPEGEEPERLPEEVKPPAAEAKASKFQEL